MKKRNLFFLLLVFITFYSCNTHEDLDLPPEESVSEGESDLFDSFDLCLSGLPADHETKSILYSSRKWKIGQTLTIKFIGGRSKQRDLVKECVAEWEKHVNLKFVFTKKSKADIRISFKKKDGNWSNIGTSAKEVKRNKPTMNLSGMEKGVYLHEIGHALGLLHEHQRTDSKISWNKEYIYQVYGQRKWSKEDIDNNFFALHGPNDIYGESYGVDDEFEYTDYDITSIMHYSFPEQFTTNGLSMPYNRALSNNDIKLISEAYPDFNLFKRTGRADSSIKKLNDSEMDSVFDDNPSTGYKATEDRVRLDAEFRFIYPVVQYYSICPYGADNMSAKTSVDWHFMEELNPRDWVLEASHDGVVWETLDRRKDERFAIGRQRIFYIRNNTRYKYYRLDIQRSRGGEQLAISDWGLYSDLR